jgi:hypothetical protein
VCTVCSVCTVCPVFTVCTVCTACTVCAVCTVYSVFCILYAVYCVLFSVKCVMCTVFSYHLSLLLPLGDFFLPFVDVYMYYYYYIYTMTTTNTIITQHHIGSFFLLFMGLQVGVGVVELHKRRLFITIPWKKLFNLFCIYNWSLF